MTVDAKKVKELRDKTGAPMMDCREALQNTACDMEKAVTYLREKGIASAGKKQGRSAKDGRIVSYIHPGDKLGVMVEINCETDFVAKGDEFADFARNIAMHIAALSPRFLTREEVTDEILEQEKNIYTTQAQQTGKPEKVIEKIVQGKMEKFYSEVCLLEQPFVKDDKMTVEEYVKSGIAKFGENIAVKRFVRFQLGEV